MIRLKRAFDPVSRTDGRRFLVERLWPRGVSKETLRVEAMWARRSGWPTGLGVRVRGRSTTLVWPRPSNDGSGMPVWCISTCCSRDSRHDDDYEHPVESAVARSAAMWCCMTRAIREALDFASSAQEPTKSSSTDA